MTAQRDTAAGIAQLAAWTLVVAGIDQGLVTVVTIVATRRRDGRVVTLETYRFPAGWRLTDNRVPDTVRRAALRLAEKVWP